MEAISENAASPITVGDRVGVECTSFCHGDDNRRIGVRMELAGSGARCCFVRCVGSASSPEFGPARSRRRRTSQP
jgi:hypothetical protein